MTITDWTLRHAFLPVMLILVFGIMGMRSAFDLPLTQLPNIGQNRIVLHLSAPDATLAATDQDLAQPVWKTLSALPNVASAHADIAAGHLRMTLTLRSSRRAQETLAAVEDRLQTLKSELDLPFSIKRLSAFSSRRQAAMELAVVSDHGNLIEASDAVRDVIRPALQAAGGVADIELRGETRTELVIRTSLAQLEAIDLTFAELQQQITAALAQKVAEPVGLGHSAKNGTLLFAIPQTFGTQEGAQGLSTLSLVTGTNEQIPLAAVAQVTTAPEPREWLVQHNGKPALLLQVHADDEADLKGLALDLDQILTALEADLPELSFFVIAKPAEDAIRSLHATKRALLEGCLLVIAVIAHSLRSWRATLLAALAIPFSVLPTLYVMQVMGLSLNIVSLLALTLASGIVVDDAIVEIENIHKRLRLGGDPSAQVARAVNEMARPVLATSCAVLAVFLPVATMQGEAGLYFQAFGYTLCIATVFSLLVSRLVIPALALHFAVIPPLHRRSSSIKKMASAYRAVLVRALRAPLLCLAGTGGIAVLSVGAALQHPGAFIPLDKSEILHIELAFPNTMSGPSRLLHIASLETELLARPDIRGVTVSVPDDVLDKSRLIVHTDGTAQAEEVVRKLVQAVPDIRSIGLKSNARPGLQLDLAASDPDTLFLAAQRLMSVIKELNEETPLVLGTPVRRAEVNFLPNPAVLRQYGLDATYVAAAVKGYASQEDHVVAVLESEERGKGRTPVRIQMAATDADESVGVEDLTFAAVRLSDGGTVPLASLGRFELEFASTRIAMRDGLYVLPILVEPSSPAHARRIAAEARKEVSRLSQEMSELRLLPAGDAETRHEMMSDLGTAASSIGLLLVATLFAMFRSLTQVFVIFASLIFALSGGMLVLKLTGLPLSLPVLIGLLLLLGIVAKNAILLIDRALILSAGQATMAQALVVAAADRARPIIMTSVAMIAGMLPAALPWLDGSAFRQPLALTVIGGVSVSTLLSLVVTPVMSLLAHRVTWRIKGLARPSALISAPQN